MRVLCAYAFLLATTAASAQVKFVDPAAAELSMTAEPKAPGAPAIVLSYEEDDDPNSAEVIVHVRIKVLTTGGLDAGTIEIPDRIGKDDFSRVFAARTIHPDGSIVPFTGSPQNSTSDESRNTKVIAMPSVTIGSIVEYGYHFQSQNTAFTYLVHYYSPVWHVQRTYFIRHAHFALRFPEPNTDDLAMSVYDKDSVHWVANLPKGAEITRGKNRFELTVDDVPAASTEEFMPPSTSAFYNVQFFYYNNKLDHYWGASGSRVDDSWHAFDKPSKLLKDAVNDIILPADDDTTKLHKLYLAVERLDNTDLGREHSEREDRADGQKTARNADTIWTNKRGDSDDLALLFVALARTAGFNAYPMAVAARDFRVFNQNVLNWEQMNDIVAIVNVNGKDVFFDPGTRFCPFGQLAPWHANVMGVSTEAKVVKIRSTPPENYRSNQTGRDADLRLAADGSVTGFVKITWAGSAGLLLRRQAIREDEKAVEAHVQQELQHHLPPGVEVTFDKLTGLKDSAAELIATFKVSGRLGEATSRRIILPAQFFAANTPRILAPETRTQPIAFPEAYMIVDRVAVQLPPQLTVEELPKTRKMVVGTDESAYQAEVRSGAMKDAPARPVLFNQRSFMLNRLDYKPEDYAPLQKYFAAIAGSDSERITLKLVPAP